jgi:hypothetical protein
MRQVVACILVSMYLVSIMGCATIVTGTTQKVPVSSNPTGATLQVDGQSTFTTPCTITLERKRDHILVFTKEGYNQRTVTLLHVISGAVCGNILLGGLIGWGIDAISGAQYKLVPENVQAELEKGSSTEAAKAAPAVLTTEEKVTQLKAMYDKGAITKEEYEANKKVLLYQMTQEGTAGNDVAGGPVLQVGGQEEKK